MFLSNMEERVVYKYCFVFIIINKYNCNCAYAKLEMGNKGKFYVGRGSQMCTHLSLNVKLKLLVTRTTFINRTKPIRRLYWREFSTSLSGKDLKYQVNHL